MPPVSTPALELHPTLAAVSFLLGTWRGSGEGGFPTVSPFSYGEEMVFAHVGKPFLSYAQRTWSSPSGVPMHAETGYLRVLPDGVVELVVAHPTGHAEVAAGTVEGSRLVLLSSAVAATASAKEVRAIRREIDVEGDVLRYRLDMEAVGHGLGEHVRATLHREEAP